MYPSWHTTLLITLTNSLYTLGSVTCPTNWNSAGGLYYCYQYTHSTGTFEEAQHICSSLNGQVVETQSATEWTVFTNYLNNFAGQSNALVWLGIQNGTWLSNNVSLSSSFNNFDATNAPGYSSQFVTNTVESPELGTTYLTSMEIAISTSNARTTSLQSTTTYSTTTGNLPTAETTFGQSATSTLDGLTKTVVTVSTTVNTNTSPVITPTDFLSTQEVPNPTSSQPVQNIPTTFDNVSPYASYSSGYTLPSESTDPCVTVNFHQGSSSKMKMEDCSQTGGVACQLKCPGQQLKLMCNEITNASKTYYDAVQVSCFAFYSTPLTWDAAFAYCSASAPNSNMIGRLAWYRKQPTYNTGKSNLSMADGQIWIGAKERNSLNIRPDIYWYATANTASYPISWAPDQTGGDLQLSSLDKSCITISSWSTNIFTDEDCSTSLPFVCEYRCKESLLPSDKINYTAAVCGTHCSNIGGYSHDGSCYVYDGHTDKQKKTWSDAQTACATLASNAVPGSIGRVAWIPDDCTLDRLKTWSFLWNNTFSTDGSFLIGLKDVGTSLTRQDLYWMSSSNTASNVLTWAPDKSSGSLGSATTIEQCMTVDKAAPLHWQAADCDVPQTFVCELICPTQKNFATCQSMCQTTCGVLAYGTCYFYEALGYNWNQAQSNCKQLANRYGLSGQLAMPKNQSTLTNISSWYTGMDKGGDAWLGLKKRGTGRTDIFWSATENAMSTDVQLDWAPDQSGGSLNFADNGNDCFRVSEANPNDWTDGNCNDQIPSVCEIQACVPPVNCSWSVWTAWSSCSLTCGNGTKSRSRTVAVTQAYGGLPCSGDNNENSTCNLQVCPTAVTTLEPHSFPVSTPDTDFATSGFGTTAVDSLATSDPYLSSTNMYSDTTSVTPALPMPSSPLNVSTTQQTTSRESQNIETTYNSEPDQSTNAVDGVNNATTVSSYMVHNNTVTSDFLTVTQPDTTSSQLTLPNSNTTVLQMTDTNLSSTPSTTLVPTTTVSHQTMNATAEHNTTSTAAMHLATTTILATIPSITNNTTATQSVVTTITPSNASSTTSAAVINTTTNASTTQSAVTTMTTSNASTTTAAAISTKTTASTTQSTVTTMTPSTVSSTSSATTTNTTTNASTAQSIVTTVTPSTVSSTSSATTTNTTTTASSTGANASTTQSAVTTMTASNIPLASSTAAINTTANASTAQSVATTIFPLNMSLALSGTASTTQSVVTTMTAANVSSTTSAAAINITTNDSTAQSIVTTVSIAMPATASSTGANASTTQSGMTTMTASNVPSAPSTAAINTTANASTAQSVATTMLPSNMSSALSATASTTKSVLTTVTPFNVSAGMSATASSSATSPLPTLIVATTATLSNASSGMSAVASTTGAIASTAHSGVITMTPSNVSSIVSVTASSTGANASTTPSVVVTVIPSNVSSAMPATASSTGANTSITQSYLTMVTPSNISSATSAAAISTTANASTTLSVVTTVIPSNVSSAMSATASDNSTNPLTTQNVATTVTSSNVSSGMSAAASSTGTNASITQSAVTTVMLSNVSSPMSATASSTGTTASSTGATASSTGANASTTQTVVTTVTPSNVSVTMSAAATNTTANAFMAQSVVTTVIPSNVSSAMSATASNNSTNSLTTLNVATTVASSNVSSGMSAAAPSTGANGSTTQSAVTTVMPSNVYSLMSATASSTGTTASSTGTTASSTGANASSTQTVVITVTSSDISVAMSAAATNTTANAFTAQSMATAVIPSNVSSSMSGAASNTGANALTTQSVGTTGVSSYTLSTMSAEASNTGANTSTVQSVVTTGASSSISSAMTGTASSNTTIPSTVPSVVTIETSTVPLSDATFEPATNKPDLLADENAEAMITRTSQPDTAPAIVKTSLETKDADTEATVIYISVATDEDLPKASTLRSVITTTTADPCTVGKYSVCDSSDWNDLTKSATMRAIAKAIQALGCAWLLICLASTIMLFEMLQYKDSKILFMLPTCGKPLSYRVRHLERILHFCQEISLFIVHICVLMFRDHTDDQTVCTITSVVMQYFTISNFAFIMLDAVQSYSLLTGMVSLGGIWKRKTYVLLGFSVPVPFVVITASIDSTQYPSTYSCWNNWGSSTILSTMLPCLACGMLALIFAEAAGHWNKKRLPLTPKGKNTSAHINRGGLFVITLANFASWFAGSLAVYFQNFALFGFVFIMNILLGVSIFFFHAMSSPEVRELAVGISKDVVHYLMRL